MSTFHILGFDVRVVGITVLETAAVDAVESVDKRAELGRKLVVSSISRCPEGVASDCWNTILVQVGVGRREGLVN